MASRQVRLTQLTVEESMLEALMVVDSRQGQPGKKNEKMRVSGPVCLYVACYDFMLGFNVSSSPLMFFQVGFWG